MLIRISVFFLLTSLLSQSAVAADSASGNVYVQPQPHSLAQPSMIGAKKKNFSSRVLPPPVISETRAVRQTDGSLSLSCREIKNPIATAAYREAQRQRFSSGAHQQ